MSILCNLPLYEITHIAWRVLIIWAILFCLFFLCPQSNHKCSINFNKVYKYLNPELKDGRRRLLHLLKCHPHLLEVENNHLVVTETYTYLVTPFYNWNVPNGRKNSKRPSEIAKNGFITKIGRRHDPPRLHIIVDSCW